MLLFKKLLLSLHCVSCWIPGQSCIGLCSEHRRFTDGTHDPWWRIPNTLDWHEDVCVGVYVETHTGCCGLDGSCSLAEWLKMTDLTFIGCNCYSVKIPFVLSQNVTYEFVFVLKALFVQQIWNVRFLSANSRPSETDSLQTKTSKLSEKRSVLQDLQLLHPHYRSSHCGSAVGCRPGAD